MLTTRRNLGIGLVLTTFAAVLAIVAGPAGAYPGAPWFEPGKAYDDNFPDPSVVVDGGRYYAYGAPTGGAYLPVMTSTDLVTWTARPVYDPGAPLNQDPFFNDALPHPASWGVDRNVGGHLKKELWAPGAAKIGGRWLVYYSVRTHLDRDRFCTCCGRARASPVGPPPGSGSVGSARRVAASPPAPRRPSCSPPRRRGRATSSRTRRWSATTASCSSSTRATSTSRTATPSATRRATR